MEAGSVEEAEAMFKHAMEGVCQNRRKIYSLFVKNLRWPKGQRVAWMSAGGTSVSGSSRPSPCRGPSLGLSGWPGGFPWPELDFLWSPAVGQDEKAKLFVSRRAEAHLWSQVRLPGDKRLTRQRRGHRKAERRTAGKLQLLSESEG